MKKFIASILLAAMILVDLAPTVASAELINDTPEESEELGVNDVENYKQQIKNVRDDVNGLEIINDNDQEMVDDFNEKSLELEENIEKAQQKAGFSDIYDLASIPQRVILLIRMGRAIRFATTQLRYKVDQAHVEIGEYVAVGLVYALSPYTTIDEMKAYMAEFEALRDKLLGYPDLALNDTANLYIRADLDVKLHKARFLKYNELEDKPSHVIDKLDRSIHEITMARLRPQATVAEIYRLSDQLDQAVAEAQNSDDTRASHADIVRLKELRRELRRARRKGDKRQEVLEVIDRANEEMLLTRPSSIAVKGIIATMESLLV